MIYLDNAATGGRKPDTVLTAHASSVKVCANPGRAGHRLAVVTAKRVEDCRNALSDFFDGYGAERTVFTKNCTEALNIALFGTLRAGDHVIVSPLEHNSVLRPLHHLQREGIITYDVCSLSQGTITPDTIRPLLRPSTKLVAVTLASNVTGATPNIPAIKAILPEHTLLLCDGAQAGGHFRVSMQRMGIDLLTLAGHKGLLGVQGSGALLFSERINPAPLLFGGTGSVSRTLDMPDFYPDALEAGTLSFPAITALCEGVRYLAVHQTEITKKLTALTDYCIKKIHTLPAYTVYSQTNPCGIIAFKHRFQDSETVATLLSESYDIAVRGGLHCAPLAHRALKTFPEGLVRASFSHYTSTSEIDELVYALSKIS